MLVISDASPVSALLQVGRGDLLVELFGSFCIPRAVQEELLRFHRVLPPFLQVREAADRKRVESLQTSLDLGEAEAIVLAIESHADYLLMDERRGRAWWASFCSPRSLA